MKLITKLHLWMLGVGVLPSLALLGVMLYFYDREMEQMIREHAQEEFLAARSQWQENIAHIQRLAELLGELSALSTPLHTHQCESLKDVLRDLIDRYGLTVLGIYDQQDALIASSPGDLKDLLPEHLDWSEPRSVFFEKISTISYVTVIAPITIDSREDPVGTLLLRQTLRRLVTQGSLRRMTTILEQVTCEQIGAYQAGYQRTTCVPVHDVEGQEIAAILVRVSTIPYLLFRKHSLLIFLTPGVSGILCMLLLRGILTRVLFRPVVALKRGMDALQSGNDAIRLPVTGDDELGDLTRHFNAMAGQIQELMQHYQESNARLERAVTQRTAELHQTNQTLQETVDTLTHTQARLVSQQTLASLGKLTAGIAHELQNPLHFISNFSQVITTLVADLERELAHTTPDPEELADILRQLPTCAQEIRTHTDRAVRTITSILSQTRHHDRAPRSVLLNPLVKDAIYLASHGMPTRERGAAITIQEQYDPALDETPLPLLPGDLSRALLNLLLNACQELQRVAQTADAGYTPVLSISTEAAAHEVIIRIRDNGRGIADDLREKIFQPFFSTKPAGEGTGLGLSIANDIITHLHGGKLDIDSVPGEYTACVIRLPKEIVH
ncbi:integral membrane sensor signal transduction histidine kinase [Candidatus Vecturithrix granuli]|uniref:histidine kinase n=1 Tax=Vecturithrix granuli TaxID=1499967 RepID=A0A081C7J7_VECG1|nr:integral membrane sensor signal transduction histidine kinase [Candidatus Vecturithrix granuli]